MNDVLIGQTKGIVASDPNDPPVSVVIDAALTHLIQSEQNLEDVRKDPDPSTIQRFNTDVLALRDQTFGGAPAFTWAFVAVPGVFDVARAYYLMLMHDEDLRADVPRPAP